MMCFTCHLLEEELSLTEVVTSWAGWLVHGQQLDPLDLLELFGLITEDIHT